MLFSLQFAQPRVSCSCSSTCLTKAGRISHGCPGRKRWEPRSSSQLQGQKMLSEGRVRLTNTHTYTLYSSSFHGRLSPHISFCDPHPTVFFLSLSFFLWIQPGFEAKAAVDSSRFVNLSTNLPTSTSNFTITFKRYIHRYTARIAQR